MRKKRGYKILSLDRPRSQRSAQDTYKPVKSEFAKMIQLNIAEKFVSYIPF